MMLNVERVRRAGRVTVAADRHSGSEEEETEAGDKRAQSSGGEMRERGERGSGVKVMGGAEAKKRREREGRVWRGKNTALSCSAALGCDAGSVSEQCGAGVWLLLAVADVIEHREGGHPDYGGDVAMAPWLCFVTVRERRMAATERLLGSGEAAGSESGERLTTRTGAC
jgi:hypothetical protein